MYVLLWQADLSHAQQLEWIGIVRVNGVLCLEPDKHTFPVGPRPQNGSGEPPACSAAMAYARMGQLQSHRQRGTSSSRLGFLGSLVC